MRMTSIRILTDLPPEYFPLSSNNYYYYYYRNFYLFRSGVRIGFLVLCFYLKQDLCPNIGGSSLFRHLFSSSSTKLELSNRDPDPRPGPETREIGPGRVQKLVPKIFGSGSGLGPKIFGTLGSDPTDPTGLTRDPPNPKKKNLI